MNNAPLYPLNDGIGRVELVDSMGDDLAVVNAARVSYGKESVAFSDKDAKLIAYLAEHGHTSPFRHVVLKFRIKAPEFVARQAYKHVVGSDYSFKDTAWNEISQRYVQVPLEFYTPSHWREQSSTNKQAGIGEVSRSVWAAQHYETAVKFAAATYLDLIETGVAREQARLVLPLSVYTEWIWTASLQAVAHFIKLRDHEGAQEEIRLYARALHELASTVAPVALSELLKESQ
jgi:thymidylate synthase (FAD)